MFLLRFQFTVISPLVSCLPRRFICYSQAASSPASLTLIFICLFPLAIPPSPSCCVTVCTDCHIFIPSSSSSLSVSPPVTASIPYHLPCLPFFVSHLTCCPHHHDCLNSPGLPFSITLIAFCITFTFIITLTIHDQYFLNPVALRGSIWI